mmetsp:Transcript_9596/g.13849  ORF Transcript_9596/g.13849 Transcript_9596/m.13849 type:complete len:106 (+) Transcript_9596:817-1134(+)
MPSPERDPTVFVDPGDEVLTVLMETPSVPFFSSERNAEIKREIQSVLETSFPGGIPRGEVPNSWLPPIVESTAEEDRSTYHDTGSEEPNSAHAADVSALNTEMVL